MKVLVTGGAGFIGRHTVKRLVEEGEQVVVVDTGLPGNLRKKTSWLHTTRRTLCPMNWS